MSDVLRQTTGWVTKWLPAFASNAPAKVAEVERVIIREVQTMFPANGRTFIRLAGLSGALAVALGAYGAHGNKK